MEFFLKDLGPLRQARFSLNDMTIICGENSTGKTYAAYALYGFLRFWRNSRTITIPDETVQNLLDNGSIELNIQEYIASAPDILKRMCEKYSERLPKFFASPEKQFSGSVFSANLDANDIRLEGKYEQTEGRKEKPFFSISMEVDSLHINISFILHVKWPEKNLLPVIRNTIAGLIAQIIFEKFFPKPFIASVERTGAALFRKEFSLTRDELFNEMRHENEDNERLKLFSQGYLDYPSPIKSNIDSTRYFELFTTEDSFLTKEHPDIIAEFSDIIGGDCQLTEQDELNYIPRGKQLTLTMAQSSSAVRSLLLIGFYLLHVAREGDLLMIDEPELNLHPKSQRRLARLFARLTKIGIKVFITTHSDYIIKELNTLIMLNSDGKRLRELAEREGYRTDEFMDHTKINVYMAKEAPVMLDGDTKETVCHTLVKAAIDGKRGIELPTFDDTIEDMNRIQEEIFWGGDE